MPAPVTSSSHARTANNKAPTTKPGSPVRKRRVVRRRGRKNSIGSDDEIERELGTDSESEDELSSFDSDSDSDTEPASEDVVPNGHSRTFTPNTSQSSDRGLATEGATHPPEPFFAPMENWSEMVAAEAAGGPQDLPVIDFANFDGKAVASPPPTRPRKAKKSAKPARPAPSPTPVTPAPQFQPAEVETSDKPDETQPRPSTSRSSSKSAFPTRVPGQSVRQAYQERLESDPSYVPTVGVFWGHDDRLLDKDLRSLSGWWRGRWQGRGRGRGFMRGRGRGGFFGSPGSHHNIELDGHEDSAQFREVPPIERQWTHDGFEEMKERDEERRAQRTQHQQSHDAQGAAGGFRGGRGFVRGGRGGFARGFVSHNPRASVGGSGRIWYQMKPERMWTKQHEGFLHFDFDPALKPRQGQGIGIQVKLPGKPAKIVRGPPRSWKATVKIPVSKAVVSTGSDRGERVYTVRLPKNVDKGKPTEPQAIKEEHPTEEVFKIRPSLAPRTSLPLPSKESPVTVDPAPIAGPSYSSPKTTDLATVVAQLEISVETPPNPPSKEDVARRTATEEAVLKKPFAEEQRPSEVPVGEQTSLPPPGLPVQPVYTPPIPQPSPATYGSPYGYMPPLPPGIAMNQHGVPYELATGRPVYLQAAPPPPPMYNPRPVMHSHMSSSSVSFVPGHVSHHSHHSTVSPDFLSHSASHTPPMNGFIDPSTGTPIFSFPRQTSRVKISAPDGNTTATSPTKPSSSSMNGTSGLRNTAAVFEPARSPAEPSSNGYYGETAASPMYAPLDGSGEGVTATNHPQDPAMAYHYPQHQHYYYPEPYYNPYVDMAQVGQYEMYQNDGYPPQGTVYY